jgi:hypothetical protein
MMRDGRALGTLNWKTDTIPLMKSSPFNMTSKELKEMDQGKFIEKRK